MTLHFELRYLCSVNRNFWALLLIGLSACSQPQPAKVPEAMPPADSTPHKKPSVLDSLKRPSDSFRRMEPDFFEIPDQLLAYPGKDGYVIVYDDVQAIDEVWLRNDALGMVLIAGMYTDGFITGYTCFYKQAVPDLILSELELIQNGEMAQLAEKRRALKGIMDQAKPAANTSFTSKKGFRLGERNKQLAMRTYGRPDSVVQNNGYEICHWHFEGDMPRLGVPQTSRPLARNSYGFSVKLIYRNERLIAMHLGNEIP